MSQIFFLREKSDKEVPDIYTHPEREKERKYIVNKLRSGLVDDIETQGTL